MNNKSINIKRRILEFFNKVDIDGDISVNDLILKLQDDVKDYDTSVSEYEQLVVDKYSNSYLVQQRNDGYVGKEVTVYHITEIEIESYTTEYTRLYRIKGDRINFSTMACNVGEINYRNNRTQEELDSYDVISKEDYDHYLSKCQEITKKLKILLDKFGGLDN